MPSDEDAAGVLCEAEEPVCHQDRRWYAADLMAPASAQGPVWPTATMLGCDQMGTAESRMGTAESWMDTAESTDTVESFRSTALGTTSQVPQLLHKLDSAWPSAPKVDVPDGRAAAALRPPYTQPLVPDELTKEIFRDMYSAMATSSGTHNSATNRPCRTHPATDPSHVPSNTSCDALPTVPGAAPRMQFGSARAPNIPSNVPPNIGIAPSKMRYGGTHPSNVPSSVPQSIPPNIPRNIPRSIPPNVPRNVAPDVPGTAPRMQVGKPAVITATAAQASQPSGNDYRMFLEDVGGFRLL